MKSILVGAAVGALLGVAFAWVAAENDEAGEGNAANAIASLSPLDYFQMGIAILTLARQLGGMFGKGA